MLHTDIKLLIDSKEEAKIQFLAEVKSQFNFEFKSGVPFTGERLAASMGRERQEKERANTCWKVVFVLLLNKSLTNIYIEKFVNVFFSALHNHT